MKSFLKQLLRFVFSKPILFTILVLFEVAFCVGIILKVAYTEIDWVAYMQEVRGFLSGERNYTLLQGDTGPLVYPAGFVYLFSGLHWITNGGSDIRLGQYIFAFLSVANLAIVLQLYSKSDKIPPWAWIWLVVSKRIHSIFVLRLFNDCFAVFLSYVALLLFCSQRWRIGCFFYSLAVSIKMNILLQAPGLLLVLLMANGLAETAICLSICAAVQLVLGFPFLSTFPVEYISRSFDLGRVFLFKWTVNWKFLPEDVFVSKELSLLLLGLTVAGLAAFAWKWVAANLKYIRSIEESKRPDLIGRNLLSSHFIITTIFVSNFIGVVFARTLHYQFYVWYFHTLPFLLWGQTKLPNTLRYLLLSIIEVCFNVYPAQPWSSGLLQGCHLLILVSIFLHPAPIAFDSHDEKKKR